MSGGQAFDEWLAGHEPPPDLPPERLEPVLDGPLPTEPDSPEEADRKRAEGEANTARAEYESALRWERHRRRARRAVDVEEMADQAAARKLRIVDGWAFLAEDASEETAIWGDGDRWGWAPGEPLMLFGGNGVFKSTLSHLLVFARLGLIGPDGAPRLDHEEVTAESPPAMWGHVLGMPVQPVDGGVLYLAGDRPKQIKRAMRRLRREWMADVLRERLVVHEGPLPFEITDSKDVLADLADHHKAADVVVDSLKDYCAKPSNEEFANGYNRARQECIARGMQWVEDHHNRKQQQGQARTNTLEDVYGNRWLTAGAGSILSMWTEAEGSAVVDVKQIKSPGEFLPHLKVTVDRKSGLMTSDGAKPDPITFVRASGPYGLTVAEYAKYSGQSMNAARNWLNGQVSMRQLEVAPEQLDKLKRFRTVLGVLPQTPQNVWQQDGLGL